MNTELHQETTAVHDLELPGACVCCGGPVDARFTPGSARGACLACHLLTPMMILRSQEGVRIVQAPAAVA